MNFVVELILQKIPINKKKTRIKKIDKLFIMWTVLTSHTNKVPFTTKCSFLYLSVQEFFFFLLLSRI